jgi:hypothetical protein
MNPVGFFVPPATNFPKKKIEPELFKDAPGGTVPVISDGGFTSKKLFVQGEADKWTHNYPRRGIPQSDICLISRNTSLKCCQHEHSERKISSSQNYVRLTQMFFLMRIFLHQKSLIVPKEI